MSHAEDDRPRASSGLPAGADLLNIAGNLVQLAGIFISLLAGVSAARRSDAALYEAEERLTKLRQDVAELNLQIRRARNGR